jgi:hypothetical protein
MDPKTIPSETTWTKLIFLSKKGDVPIPVTVTPSTVPAMEPNMRAAVNRSMRMMGLRVSKNRWAIVTKAQMVSPIH